MLQLYHSDSSAWGASHRDFGDRSAWGAPHRVGILETGSGVLHRGKIRVPGMLLTGILEIGVLEVLLVVVVLPSDPDNLAIWVSPVG